MSWAIAAGAAASIGVAWVTKLMNKQPQDVSAYFSGNGEYAGNVARQKGIFNDTFGKYAVQLAEGSEEAKEYLQICKPSLDWMGQRNAPITSIATMNTEGQRLVNKYQSQSIIGKAADVLNTAIDPDTLTKITDPIKNFFSYFSLTKDEPEQATLGTPKTDTIIPILLTQEPQASPAITVETQEATTKENVFDKFALPIGMFVIGGLVLFMTIRR